MSHLARRVAYVILCVLPLLAVALAGARQLRIPGVYSVVGGLLFVLILASAWMVGAHALKSASVASRRLVAAGALLLTPWALIALLWVGIGAPFQATVAENHGRFLLLIGNSLLVTIGFIVLYGSLIDRGERFWPTLGFATSLPAGIAYLICLSLSAAQTAMALHGARAPLPPILDNFYDIIEFIACVLTYTSTAIFAIALGFSGVLGRGAVRAYVIASAILVSLLAMRGIAYPEISGQTAAWYTQPGIIAGIPAIPWIMPGMLAAVLLRGPAQ